jgi:hypothetical protein
VIRNKPGLYWIGLCKGKMLFDQGDNIYEVFRGSLSKWEIDQDKKPLTWFEDFTDEFRHINRDLDFREGGIIPDSFNPGKYYHSPEEKSINKCIVIFNKRGTIKGVIQISRNNKEELKAYLEAKRSKNGK